MYVCTYRAGQSEKGSNCQQCTRVQADTNMNKAVTVVVEVGCVDNIGSKKGMK